MNTPDIWTYNGYKVRIDPRLTDGYIQRRTHKKSRINKKWRKRYGLKPAWDMKTAMIIENYLYISKGLYNKLYRTLQKESE